MSDIVLFDASSIAYYRYFSRLKKPEGPSALQWIEDFEARSGAAKCFIVGDSPRNWRQAKAPEYKQQRPERPAEVAEALRDLSTGGQWIEIDGYEADDTIAVLVHEHPNDRIVIVANDKDLHQLVSPRVLVYDPVRDFSFDVEAVIGKWECAPHQMRMMLALMGDKSDNLPGVPGVGQKRAAQVAARMAPVDVFAALERRDVGMFKDIGLSASLADMIVTFRDTVRLNYELVGLRTVRP